MSTARGFLGAGDLYVARFNPTTQRFEDYAGPFEASKFEIKPNSERKEMVSRGRGTYGQTIESVPIPKAFEFAVTFAEINRESLSLALLGTQSDLSQGSGTVTDAKIELSAARFDKWIDLAHSNLGDAGFSVKSNNGSTTYAEGTDYVVNRRLGAIKPLSAGAIPATETVKVGYSYAAVSGIKIDGATQTQVRAKFRLDGINFADQSPVVVDVFEGVTTPDSAFDFLQDEFAEAALTGSLKTPAGMTSPFQVKLPDPA